MRLLVVCTANIARSPLAEAMLASSLSPHGIEVASAGTRAQPYYAAAEATQELARRRGLDVSAHRSRIASEELLAAADLVLTMSERQRDDCAPRAPRGGEYMFTLPELVRLLAYVDAELRAPAAPAERLAWLATEAHRVRPVAPPSREPENVHDPIRDPWPAWVEMGAVLDQLCGRVVAAAGTPRRWQPATGPQPAPASFVGAGAPEREPVRRGGERRHRWRRRSR